MVKKKFLTRINFLRDIDKEIINLVAMTLDHKVNQIFHNKICLKQMGKNLKEKK